jgi:uncharacterized lipoprotein YajG
MKKILFIFVAFLMLTSCDTTINKTSIKYRMDVYENMTPPIIVVAQRPRVVVATNKRGEPTAGMKGSIMLSDSKGVTVVFTDVEAYGSTLVANYVKGDTLLSIIK